MTLRNTLILIVEDNYNNIQYLGKLLTEEGYETAVALNGSRAMEFLTNRKPDLILLDVMLPDVDGYELCRRIKSDNANDNIPVIFLTARSEKEDVIKGLKMGAVDYIIRPCNSLELIARIRTHIELKLLREEYYQQSIKDDLTGLFNRRYVLQRMQQEWERGRRYGTQFSIALIDIDNFKQINDSHGHLEGDKILKKLSGVIKTFIRKTDIPGRFGGDEFALLFPETDAKQSEALLSRLMDHLRNEKGDLEFTLSIGICGYNETTPDLESLIGQADSALYKSKNLGKDRISIYYNRNESPSSEEQ